MYTARLGPSTGFGYGAPVLAFRGQRMDLRGATRLRATRARPARARRAQRARPQAGPTWPTRGRSRRACQHACTQRYLMNPAAGWASRSRAGPSAGVRNNGRRRTSGDSAGGSAASRSVSAQARIVGAMFTLPMVCVLQEAADNRGCAGVSRGTLPR